MNKHFAKVLAMLLIITTIISISLPQFNARASTAGSHSHPVCGDICSCGGGHTDVSWEPLPTDASTLYSGHYYLESDVCVTAFYNLRTEGDVSVCLNGHRLYTNGNSNVIAANSGTLKICDCVGNGKIATITVDDVSFGGSGTVCVSKNASLIMYGGTIECGGIGSGIACGTTGNLQIYGGNINTKKGSGIDISKINDITISSCKIISTNGDGIEFGGSTFRNLTISGGYIEGYYTGVTFDTTFTCTGRVLISGGTLYSKGTVPNATTYAGDYYGLSFQSSNGGACNVTVSGGLLDGARGGFYSNNPLVNLTVSGGVLGHYDSYSFSDYKDGIEASQAGNIQINGGKIYGLNGVGPINITMTDGELLSAGFSNYNGNVNFKMYGGTVGRVNYSTSTVGISHPSFSPLPPYQTTIQIYRGTVIGTEYAIRNNACPGCELQLFGGTLSGGTADIYLNIYDAEPTESAVSLKDYTGESLSVKVYPEKENSCIAENVSKDGLISLVSNKYIAVYDSKNKTVKIGVPHTHSYEKNITAPTCTKQGYTTYVCECGDTYVADYVDIDSNAHSYTSEIKTPATHLTTGVMTYTCGCGNTYTEVIDKIATHNHTSVVTAPTCTEQGFTTYTCECGDSYVADYVDETGHSYTAETTTPATHLTTGVMTYTCDCGDTYTETIEKTAEHDYKTVVTAPTCTEKGYTTYTCECGDSYVDDYVAENGHNHTSEITTPATHLTTGVETFTCECGDTYTETIEKITEHTYDSVVTAPTCTEQGYTTYTCECGDTYVSDYVAVIDHGYKATVTRPTCTEKGYTTNVCSSCGDSYIDNYKGAIGHDYDNGIVTTKPTCTKAGIKTFTCANCGDTYTEDVDALGHTPSSEVEENYVAPICTENGSKDVVIYCSACDEEISRETVILDASGHADNDGDGYCDVDNELLDPTVECECNCHKSGISKIFFNFILFFQRLFGANKECACGVAHY